MKKILLLTTYTVIGYLNAHSVELENRTFEIKDGESLRLDYRPASQSEQIVQNLYLKSSEKEDLVSSIQAKHQIDSNGSHGKISYENCSIFAASHQLNKLLVLYAFEKGRQQVIRADHSQRGYAKPFEIEKDLLLVLYSKDQNAWKTEMSVYIQTMWGDIIGEKVSGIKIAGDQSYELKFNRKWMIEGTKSAISDDREKVQIPNGLEVKNLQFDDKLKIIYTLGNGGDKLYTLRTVWWIGENKDHIEDLRQRWDARMRAETEARAKEIELVPENTSLLEVLKANNIALMDLQFIPEANGHQDKIKITKDLRENQEQNKSQQDNR